MAGVIMGRIASARTLSGSVQGCTERRARMVPQQRNPKNGAHCCNEADGVYAEEDIRNDRYWVRFDACDLAVGCRKVDWMPVPPDAVIYDPDRNGAPVVWWYIANDRYQIRCYAPGAGI